MAKQSSYQKLKAQIARQQEHIDNLRNIIVNDDLLGMQSVKNVVRIERQSDAAIWDGDVNSKGNGILSSIKPASEGKRDIPTGVKIIPAKYRLKEKCSCGQPGNGNCFCPYQAEIDGVDNNCGCCDNCFEQCKGDI